MEMAAGDLNSEQTELTMQLPDELLCHLFSFLPLKDKMRLEAVSHKFQRCVLEELKSNPRPLELDIWAHSLNGHHMPLEQINAGVQMLAKKAKFSSVWLRIGPGPVPQWMERLASILSLLISEKECLENVTSFTADSGCTQSVLEEFLDQCAKLSTVRFEFDVRPVNSEPSGFAFPMDLGKLFKDRPLTEIKLRPFRYNLDGLTSVFKAMKPNSIRKVDLLFCEMPALNPVELVNALGICWSALEEMHLQLGEIRVNLVQLFQSLAGLPALRKCDIKCLFHFQNPTQFITSVTTLLMESQIKIAVSFSDGFSFFDRLRGCQIVKLIRQIQVAHPGLVLGFDADRSFTLSVGNKSIRKSFVRPVQHCANVTCIQAQSFYPVLLIFLRSRARDVAHNFLEAAMYFPHWQVDRCKIGNLLNDLQPDGWPNTLYWRPLAVELNEGQQLITIHFETEQMMPYNQFSIIISCGHCITNGCTQCTD